MDWVTSIRGKNAERACVTRASAAATLDASTRAAGVLVRARTIASSRVIIVWAPAAAGTPTVSAAPSSQLRMVRRTFVEHGVRCIGATDVPRHQWGFWLTGRARTRSADGGGPRKFPDVGKFHPTIAAPGHA